MLIVRRVLPRQPSAHSVRMVFRVCQCGILLHLHAVLVPLAPMVQKQIALLVTCVLLATSVLVAPRAPRLPMNYSKRAVDAAKAPIVPLGRRWKLRAPLVRTTAYLARPRWIHVYLVQRILIRRPLAVQCACLAERLPLRSRGLRHASALEEIANSCQLRVLAFASHIMCSMMAI